MLDYFTHEPISRRLDTKYYKIGLCGPTLCQLEVAMMLLGKIKNVL